MYNHLKRILEIVKELNQVTLENVHAASKRSTWATGRGKQGGGCRGHGRHGACRVICNEKLDLWIIEFQLISYCSESLFSNVS